MNHKRNSAAQQYQQHVHQHTAKRTHNRVWANQAKSVCRGRGKTPCNQGPRCPWQPVDPARAAETHRIDRIRVLPGEHRQEPMATAAAMLASTKTLAPSGTGKSQLDRARPADVFGKVLHSRRKIRRLTHQKHSHDGPMNRRGGEPHNQRYSDRKELGVGPRFPDAKCDPTGKHRLSVDMQIRSGVDRLSLAKVNWAAATQNK